jgi:hypothetical protein
MRPSLVYALTDEGSPYAEGVGRGGADQELVDGQPSFGPDALRRRDEARGRADRETPTIGAVYPSSFERTVRKLLMPKSENHLYYAVREGEVIVLSVWGAPRGPGPKL